VAERINRVEVVFYSERDKMKRKEWYLVLLLLALLLLLCGLTGRTICVAMRSF
jgi:accessory gene regulator protein AgrB